MNENSSHGPTPQGESATESTPGAEKGPLSLTRREEQRRRLIVAGVSTPALMTLPSRRVWAAKCSKSKLLSGNLSAVGKKKGSRPKLEECQNLGCDKSFWKGGKAVYGVEWDTTKFSDVFSGEIFGDKTLKQVAGGENPAIDVDGHGVDDDVEKALKAAGREIASAYLNAYFIRNDDPGHLFNFILTVEAVMAAWEDPEEYQDMPTLPALPDTPMTGDVKLMADYSYGEQESLLAAALGAKRWYSWYYFYKKTNIPGDGENYDDGNGNTADVLAAWAKKQLEEKIAPDIIRLTTPLAEANNSKYCPF